MLFHWLLRPDASKKSAMTGLQKKPSYSPGEKSAASRPSPQSLVLIHGDDDFLVNQEAQKIINSLTPKSPIPGAPWAGLEIIEGFASNQAEAITIFRLLFEALQTRSFFASEKIVWWRNTNLLGAGSTASASAVADSLAALNDLLKSGLSPGFSLVVTATETDARKAVFRTFQQQGRVIAFKTDPYKQQENQAAALLFARETASKLNKQIEEDAGFLIVEMAGCDSRTIASEIEKLAAYVGDEGVIREQDVHAIGSRRPGGVVWNLTDALSERNLSKALRALDNLIFLGETPMGMLFALVARVRLLLLISVLVEKKLIKTGGSCASFKSQLDGLPSWVVENLPRDKKLNPLAGHPFMLWKASVGIGNYTRSELQQALASLLECNERMVSGGEPQNALEETLLKICAKSCH